MELINHEWARRDTKGGKHFRRMLRRGHFVVSNERVEGKFAPLAGREVGWELERAEGGAMKREDRGAGGGEHAADLVVATLGEDEAGFARGEKFERGGSAGFVFTLEEKRAGGE